MAFRTIPQLGPDSEQIGPIYADVTAPGGVSFQLGTTHFDSAGRQRMWVQAGATIAASTQVSINASTFVATAGAGGWYTSATPSGGVTNGQYFHAVKGTAP